MTAITPTQKQLITKAQALRPVVLIGAQGLSDNVIAEIDQALRAHELIKIKVNAITRDDRKRMIRSICDETESELIQSIGHVAVLYRKNTDD